MMEKSRYETKKYLEKFENCLEREIPYCMAACPFHLPIFNFMEKVQRGALTAAFKVYRDAAGFPRIASSLCDAPCKKVCPRMDFGGSIQMDWLEKASLRLTGSTSAVDYNIPPKKERVAVIGAGVSGMAACLRLSTKKYHVEVFEAEGRIGGQLWDLLPPEIFLSDIEEQLAYQEYVLHLNTKITDIASLARDFDAVYVASGQNGEDFGLLGATGDAGDPYCMRIGHTGIFAGGALLGKAPVYALADGLCAGTVIDNFLKTGKLYYPSNEGKTRMCAGMAVPHETAAAIEAADKTGYTKEEAAAEAKRCIRCQCHACREHCDLAAFADKWPVRIRDEIVATTLEGKSELKATPAKRLMSLCSQCGLCKEVCPEAIDMDGLFLAGRSLMHRQGKMPWPFYDFWLRDMRQADACGITRTAPDTKGGRYAFFPGCQLGASEPELTEKTYARLLEKYPDTGLMLRCCGVPLEWAGQTQAFAEALEEIEKDWEMLGKPVMLLACPTCMKTFREHLPQIPVRFLYEALEETAQIMQPGQVQSRLRDREWAVFDACSARHDERVKQAVRKLAVQAGCRLTPLLENDKYGKCCGYGGQGAIASPDYRIFVADRRVSESQAPYITYCINCRDIFLERGKEAVHILELLLGDGSIREKVPTVTQRQENRVRLKQALLAHWGEKMEAAERKVDIKVHIDDALSDKLNRERILEEEIISVIDFCQRHDRRILNTETGTYSGYRQVGMATYWVEYTQLDESGKRFELVNAYSHRMKIELEAVWNGERQNLDLQ